MCKKPSPLLDQQRSFDRLRLFSEGGDRWSAELRSYPSPTGRMFFHVQIGSITMLALYDPGADVTLMKSSIYDQLKGEALGPVNPAPATLSQACGAPVRNVKQATFKMNVGGQVATCPIFVCPTTAHDLIVGMPEINTFGISYDAKRRKLTFAGHALLKIRTSKVLQSQELAQVDCYIEPGNPLDWKMPSTFTIGTEDDGPDEDLYVMPMLVTGYKAGDTIKVPIKNLSVNDIDLKTLTPSDVIGVTQEAKDPIPLSAFKIGDLPMPPLVPCPEDKKKYLLSNLKLGPGLPDRLLKRCQDLFIRKHQAFGANEYDLGHTDSYVHRIDLKAGNESPVFNKQFQLSEHARRFLQDHIKELVRVGVLENSQSAWNSCCFVVPKPSGSYRMVIDLRSVNAKTIPVIHNGVNVDDLIRNVGRLQPKVLSSCDILKGFWQVPLHPDSREYTSFNIPTIGSFRYTVAPMGASGSVYGFWTLMGAVTHGLQNTLCYLDDLITASKSADEHLEHLERLFDRIIMHKLTLGIDKCSFFQEKVDFLGFEVTSEGMRPGAPKTEVIKQVTPPDTLKTLRGFVGLTNYFSHHLPFQREAKHLTSLTRTGSGWTKGALPPRALLAFNRIKTLLTRRPLLRYPDYNREFLLFTDAATGKANKEGTTEVGGLGAFLAQQDDKGRIYPLGYAGRGLKKHEENYSAFVLELAAALFGLEEFKHIIDRFPTRLFTDHQPLQAYSNPLSDIHRRTMTRLTEAVMAQPWTVHYHPGLLNGVADTLSRIEYRRTAGLSEEEHPAACALMDDRTFRHNLVEAVQVFVPVWSYTSRDLRKMQEGDSLLSRVIKHVKRTEKSDDPRVLQAAKMSLINDQGLLFQRKPGRFKWGRYLLQTPDCIKPDVLWHGHDSRMGGAHTGIERTFARISSLFVWDEMLQDITEYVTSCHMCQSKSNRNKPPPGQLREMPTERLIGGRVHIDTYGEVPVDEHGNKYILVFICAFSRYAKMVAVASKDAVTVARAFKDHWVCTFGVPLVVVSDNGTEYVNEVMGAFLNLMGTEHRTTSPVHPQPNGKVERVNATLRNYIRSYVDWSGQNWSDCLAELNFSYNTSVHRGLRLSPFEVVFNYQPRFPGFETEAGINDKFYGEGRADLIPAQIKMVREFAASQSKEFQTQWTSRMNRFRVDPEYKRGDQVMFHDPARAGIRQKVKGRKFLNPWLGPCEVVEFFPRTLTVKLKVPSHQGKRSEVYRVHAERVKPYIGRDSGKWIRGPGLEDEVGLPNEESEESLRQLSKELKETQLELEYDDDTLVEEGLEFLDRAPYTNEDDMVRWPASRGHPLPRVEVEDPGMVPGDALRHGTQGTLGNPRGTVAGDTPAERPMELTPDRVVVRRGPPKPLPTIPPPKMDRPAGTGEPPRKRVRLGQFHERPISPRGDGPAQNTRRRAQRQVACIRITCGSRLISVKAVQSCWLSKLSSTGGVQGIRMNAYTEKGGPTPRQHPSGNLLTLQ